VQGKNIGKPNNLKVLRPKATTKNDKKTTNKVLNWRVKIRYGQHPVN
jgi:hypothetical protein